MTEQNGRPQRIQIDPARAGRLCLAALVLATLALLGSGCAKPLERGDGPTTLTIRPIKIDSPTGRLVGRVKVEVVDYEDECPRLFSRSLFSLRKAAFHLSPGSEPVQVAVIPGHLVRFRIRHQGSADQPNDACTSEVWFMPGDGAHYDLTLRSHLNQCSVGQLGSGASKLVSYPSCEALLASESEPVGDRSGTDD